INRHIDTPVILAEVVNSLIAQESLYAALRTIDKVQDFADRNGKKVLYVLSYGFDNVETILKTGKRFDQEVVNLLRERRLPYVDLIEAYAADFSSYRVAFSEYGERHLVGGHLSPMGNLFVAFAIKDKLVKLMEPKPPAYAVKDTGKSDAPK